MDTKSFKVTVGSPNIIIDKYSLIERAKKVGVTDNQIEELSLAELERIVMFKELQQKGYV